MQLRKERLLGLNARLAASFTEGSPGGESGGGLNNRTPLSAMLSKLKESCTATTPTQPSSSSASNVTIKEERDVSETSEKKKKTKRRKTEEKAETPTRNDGDDGIVPSPDLAMLAAASMKHDNRPTSLHGFTPETDEEKPKVTHRSLSYTSPPLPHEGSFLVQPNVSFQQQQQQQQRESLLTSSSTSTQSVPSRKMMNGTLSPNSKHHKKKSDKTP